MNYKSKINIAIYNDLINERLVSLRRKETKGDEFIDGLVRILNGFALRLLTNPFGAESWLIGQLEANQHLNWDEYSELLDSFSDYLEAPEEAD